MDIEVSADEFFHYGVLHRSGRYPWGSGATPHERSQGFLGYVDNLKKQGLSDAQIAKGLSDEELGIKLTSSHIRAARSIATSQVRQQQVKIASDLKAKAMSNTAIAKQMGLNESSVRSLLDPIIAEKQAVLESTANMLKEKMGDGYLDIGAGTENHLAISSTKLATAVALLKEEGYEVKNIQIPQLGTSGNQKTTTKVLIPPGAPKFIDPTKIKTVAAYSTDGGLTYEPILPPHNISSSRIGIKYAEDGGAAADGVIYVRPGVQDVSLGPSRYAQVRIAVDGTHYLKGMAMYKDNLPAGTDLVFNTNKPRSVGKMGAMKSQKEDPENPFGTDIKKQLPYVDAAGNKKISAMNIVNEEGNWSDWSRTLSSQFLSKQSTALATKQLDAAYNSRKSELDEINSLTNPVIKKKLLNSFADGSESAAVHLKAAAIPGQSTNVILPFASIKPNEVYAPNYHNGDRVVLVRFPHGGTFELPELTVNNKNKEADAALGASHGRPKAVDAIGIHPNTAKLLSGADFDGDTVLVIPNNDGKVKTSAPLAGLKNFDPQIYKIDRSQPGAPRKISPRAKQQQMGDVSNLITDMTIKGAKPDELARAVRHSMVVIDAEKHDLDYKRSYVDNQIASLKKTYQGVGPTGRLGGAATIVSRSGNATIQVPEKRLRKASEGGSANPATGKRVYVTTGGTHDVRSAVNLATGKRETIKRGMQYDPATVRVKTGVPNTSTSKPLLEVSNAHELSSGIPIEEIYADHSNRMMDLSHAARKASLETGGITYSPTAAKAYAPEVARLKADLNLALQNKPLERQAQIIAKAAVSAKVRDNPGMENADLKKINGQELQRARDRIGAKKRLIPISDRQWEAIQAGAVSTKRLSDIIDNTNLDELKKRALPREATVMTPERLSRAKQMIDNGATQAEVASALGIPTSTLNSALLNEGS